VEASASPNLAIRQDRVIEPRDSIRVPEIVIYTITGLLHIRSYVKGHVLAHLKLETGRWHHRIKKPLRCDLPTDPGGRDNLVFPLHIDANPENKLQIRTVNVSAADEEREIEIVPSQAIELTIVDTGLTFDPHYN